MDLKNNFYILLVSLLFLSSCVSTYDLMDSHATDVARFSTTELNGNYSNSGDDKYHRLWNTLTNFKSSKRDTITISKNAVINLHFENEKRLIMTAYENNKVLKTIVLKGNMKGDYFSIKRKLFLIPIPFFFIHQETKVILGQGQSGNVIVKYGKEKSAWILIMAGGGLQGYYEDEYPKLDLEIGKN